MHFHWVFCRSKGSQKYSSFVDWGGRFSRRLCARNTYFVFSMKFHNCTSFELLTPKIMLILSQICFLFCYLANISAKQTQTHPETCLSLRTTALALPSKARIFTAPSVGCCRQLIFISVAGIHVTNQQKKYECLPNRVLIVSSKVLSKLRMGRKSRHSYVVSIHYRQHHQPHHFGPQCCSLRFSSDDGSFYQLKEFVGGLRWGHSWHNL